MYSFRGEKKQKEREEENKKGKLIDKGTSHRHLHQLPMYETILIFSFVQVIPKIAVELVTQVIFMKKLLLWAP